MGVFVGVSGNQITVGVGVAAVVGLAVGVGGIRVGGEQADNMQMTNVQICKNTCLLPCRVVDLPIC